MGLVSKHEQRESRPNLYLAGFMGVGKSAVGRGVARQLGMRFIDSDRAIEQEFGQSVADIFAHKGEAIFRGYEVEFIERGHPPAGCVISLGGGLVMNPNMPERLQELGVLVCLFASLETIMKRVLGNDRRPLLNVPDREQRLQELWDQREPVYLKCGTSIGTENRTLHEIIGHVMRVYQSEAARWAKAQQKSEGEEHA